MSATPILSDPVLSDSAQTVKRYTIGLLGLTVVGVTISIGILIHTVCKYHYNSLSRDIEFHRRRLKEVLGRFAGQQRDEQQQLTLIGQLLQRCDEIPEGLTQRIFLLEATDNADNCSKLMTECHDMMGKQRSILPWRWGDVYEKLGDVGTSIDRLDLKLGDTRLMLRNRRIRLSATLQPTSDHAPLHRTSSHHTSSHYVSLDNTSSHASSDHASSDYVSLDNTSSHHTSSDHASSHYVSLDNTSSHRTPSAAVATTSQV